METLPPPIKLEPLKRKATARSLRNWWRRKEGPRALRDIRERKGISLQAIAARTRIPLHHLEEIERGDLSQLPTGVYARSWAREYASEIGVDPETVLAAVALVAAVEPTIDEITQVREERERRVERTAAALAPMPGLMKKVATVGVVLALLVLAAIYLWRVTAPDRVPTAPVTSPR